MWMNPNSTMTKRINVILPEATIRTIDRIAKPGERSLFIKRAVEHYVATQSAEAVRKRLEVTATRDRDLDREIANDWFAVDQESWRQLDKTGSNPRKPATQSVEKSTSRRSIRR
jgi:CopG family transcriptional regulator / antitoxin EndoAI